MTYEWNFKKFIGYNFGKSITQDLQYKKEVHIISYQHYLYSLWPFHTAE